MPLLPSHKERLVGLLGGATRDPFCVALHNMVQNSNLVVFDYLGPVHRSLFWPDFVAPRKTIPYWPDFCKRDNREPVWPTLQTLNIETRMHGDPQGLWYFDRSDEDGVFPALRTLKIRQAFTNPASFPLRFSMTSTVTLKEWPAVPLLAATSRSPMVLPKISSRLGSCHGAETTIATVRKKYMK